MLHNALKILQQNSPENWQILSRSSHYNIVEVKNYPKVTEL